MYDDIDHAEHAAVEAELRAEHEAEQAHLDYTLALVAELRSIAADARDAGLATAQAITDELLAGAPVNAHRHELLARQQYAAALAPLAADAVEQAATYGLVEVVEAAADSFLTKHSTGRDDQLGRAVRGAADLVIAVARAAAAHSPSEAPTAPGRRQ